MKVIINNKLYDTKKAKLIYEYSHKWFESCSYIKEGWGFVHWEKAKIYKTKNNNYFTYFYHNGYPERERIETTSIESVKCTIRNLDPDKYIELFGEVEEA